MGKLIDITDKLEHNRKYAWARQVEHNILSARTEAEKLYWNELRLCLLFTEYHEKHGEYHENDPVRLNEEGSYLTD
tara:strand:+ start:624 stop:851 length:228 start_codon:yes stop_codon:yes gene_type:complete